MRLFTFSGIAPSLIDTNDGSDFVKFGKAVCRAMPAGQRPAYNSNPGIGHFQSYVNWSGLLADIDFWFAGDGSDTLNEESEQYASVNGDAVRNAMKGNPEESIAMLAHSQGTNNLMFSLHYLLDQDPHFFQIRKVRCAIFDPKVGKNQVLKVFTMDVHQSIQFVFFQSQNDVLGNQSVGGNDFIKEFPHGDHIWVKGLNHGSIREWSSYTRRADWMNLNEYRQFSRDHGKKIIQLKRELKGALNTKSILKLQRWVKRYLMNTDRLCEAVLGFLSGNLPQRFRS
jgi:hypothetical protein